MKDIPNPRKEAGRQLKELREAAGLSQNQVGEVLGKTGKLISAIERGACRPPDRHLAMLATAYGVSSGLIIRIVYQAELDRIVLRRNRLIGGDGQ